MDKTPLFASVASAISSVAHEASGLSIQDSPSENILTDGSTLANEEERDSNEQGVESISDSDDDAEADTRLPTVADKRKAQNNIFAAWLSRRTAKATKLEVQRVIENADEETLSIKALMSKQDSAKIITDPREYQIELFERAKSQNIVAVLDTGSGKTLIAVLLLRHIIDIELADRLRGKSPRISFFLVDCVTLVFQQAAVLDTNLDQKIDRFCGEMGTDMWSRDTWKQIFADNMVVVCTAEILYQCLMHAFISLDQINLLIFDEAHHAKKNHVYAKLINDFYISHNVSTRPKIFGMTASPVDAREDEIEAARKLEAVLRCQIATASNLALLRHSISRPSEVLLPYHNTPSPEETPLCSLMRSKVADLYEFDKHLNNSVGIVQDLGTWCADQIWSMALIDEENFCLERKIERGFFKNQETRSITQLDVSLRRLKEAREVAEKWIYPRPNYSDNSISPKVKSLLGYLDQAFGQNKHGKCIIFVNKRWTARLLCQLLKVIGTRYLLPDVLIGTRPGDAGDTKISFRQQLGSLNNLRKGVTNCLIATSIAEEGLDIPDCNLVIRFDLYTTLIQYIQSRGRARHVESVFVHMVEAGNKAHLQAIIEMRRGEEKLRNFCELLPADRLLLGNGDGDGFKSAGRKVHCQRKFVDPETGATLTYGSSLVVLSHFVACLPNTGDDIQQPIYHTIAEKRHFVCEVILPEKSPIRSATGRPASSKAMATRSAAFEACLLLRQKGYIDSHLISTYHKILPQMRNARLALTANTTHVYPMKIKPSIWEVGRGSLPRILHITILEVETPANCRRPVQPIAILTRAPLPQFPSFWLHLQLGQGSNLCTFKGPVTTVTGDTLNLLDSFTLRIFDDVFSKLYESDMAQMSYWLAPVTPDWRTRQEDNILDWELLHEVFVKEKIVWSADKPAEEYIDRFLVDPWGQGIRYYSLDVERSLCPSDRVPTGASKHRFMNNIMDYTVSLWTSSRKKTFEESAWNMEQPVFRAHQLIHRINWLDDFTEKQDNVNTQAWVCLEPLKISVLPTGVVAMARMLPGIITRLESYLIALEAFSNLTLTVKPELALEAFTKDSDNTKEHRAEQLHLQRGMGKNYERLEFIGDCFLKMATSISLFSQMPEDSEFEYHVNRMVMICNKHLLGTALANNIQEHIRSVSFSRSNWYPQGLTLLRGKGFNKATNEIMKHRLADKTIADVCEAMIGATLLSYREQGNMDMAVKAVTALVCSEDHNVTSWSGYYPLYTKPRYQLAESSASHLDLAMQVERKHAYHFKYPRLLRSAFIHPSQPFATEKIPSYQRLEFLGDALLDMASVNYLYHRHPDRDPQWLTEHKMAMVSNKFLAALAVKLGFHKHLRYMGAVIEKQNREYVIELGEARDKADGARDYWTNTKQPPKALSDILEAFVGAVFVDAEYDFKEVERFFDAHMRWFFEDMSIYDTFANNHPTTYLHKLLTLSFGCTEYRLIVGEQESLIPGGDSTSVAGLMVHDEIVAEGEASSSKVAKVKASSAALKIMQAMTKLEYKLHYKCDCEGTEKTWVGNDGDGMGMVGTAI